MFDTLSGPARFLVTRLVVIVVAAVVGLGLYALGVGVAPAVLLAFGVLVVGEVFLFAAGEGL